MRGSRGDDDANDGRLAARAGLALSLIHTMLALKAARLTIGCAVVHQGGSAGFDGGTQYALNAAQQFGRLFARQVTCAAARVNACAVERFVAIDVAQPGDHTLIEKKGFDLAVSFQDASEASQVDLERFLTEWGESFALIAFGAIQQPDSAKTSRVTKAQLVGCIAKRDTQMGVSSQRSAGRVDRDASCHAKRKHNGDVALKVEQNAFPASGDTLHTALPKVATEQVGITLEDVPATQSGRSENFTTKRGVQRTGDRFCFG